MRRALALIALGTLSACDCAGPTGSAPVVRIVTPADGTLFQSPGPHPVLGEVTDPDESIPPDRVLWKSDRDGTLALGASTSIVLSAGEHRLSLEATDRNGNVGMAQITVRVATGTQTDGGTDGGTTDGGTNPDGGNSDPTVVITSPTNNAFFDLGMPIPLNGSASDPEDGPLTGASLVWTSDRAGVLGTGGTLTFNNAALGAHRLVLTATDRNGASAIASVTVTVVQPGTNRPPVATITAPTNGAQLVLGTPTPLQGSATDVEDGTLVGASLTWSSDRDGALGTGTALAPTLSQGVHVITLTARDSQNATGTASVTVSVNQPNNQPPTVAITQPTSMLTVFQGTSVTFAGTGTDPEDGALTGPALAWTSSLDGALGTGSPLTNSTLTVGDHTITLVGTDSGGNSDTASVVVRVLPANQPPVVTITAPANNTQVSSGTSLAFTGTALDPEDGPLTGASIRWSSSLDGTLGTGSPLNTASLSVGTHTITLAATDSGGRSGSASITVTVTMSSANVPPIARLTGPTSGTTVDTLTFDGSTSTDSDGSIVSWSFDFGDGTPPVTSAMTSASHVFATAGTFTVTLTVTDNRGATATATLTVTITTFVRVPVVALPAIADVGTACQIATPGARVFLAWTSGVHPAIFFGERINGTITPELVDGLGFEVGGVVRQLISMKVEANGTPHLVYVRDNTVIYATRSGGAWIHERVDATTPYTSYLPGDETTSPSLILNGTTPIVLYTTGFSAASSRPVVATRTAPGTWSQATVTVPGLTTNDRQYPYGDVAIDATGRVIFPLLGFDATTFNASYRLVAWTSAATTSVAVTPSFNNRVSTALTPGGHLLMSGATGVFDVTLAATFTASTFTLSPAELSTLSQHAIAADSNGWPRVVSKHGTDLEAIRSLGAPGFWEWTYLGGPVTAGILDVSVDGADQTRACFIRSGNLMVY
ncbi:MAG: PKD domain-containing protein [Myxococcaceae bacterium]